MPDTNIRTVTELDTAPAIAGFEELGAAAEETGLKVKASMEGAFGGAAEGVEADSAAMRDSAAGDLAGIGDAAALSGADISEHVGQAAEDAGSKIQDLGEDASGVLGSSGSISRDAEDAGEDVSEHVGQAAEDAGSKIQDLGEDATNVLGNRVPTEADEAGKHAEKLGDDLEKTGAKGAESGNVIGDALNSAGSKVPILGSALTKMGGRINDANLQGKGFSQTLVEMGRVASIGVVAGFAAAAGESAHLASQYQEDTATLAGQAGITTAKAKAIGDAFLGTAGTTTFTAKSILEAFSPVAGELKTTQGHALGVAGSMQFMRSATTMAEATQTSLGSTTSSLATIMQAYGIKVKGTAGVATDLYNAQRMTGNSAGQLTTQFQRLHTQMGNETPSLTQLSGLLVDMTAHGESGRSAISALSTGMGYLYTQQEAVSKATIAANQAFEQLPPKLQKLATAYKDGKMSGTALEDVQESLPASQAALLTSFTGLQNKVVDAKQAYNNLGIELNNSKGQFVGVRSVIAQLQPALQGMTSQQKQLAVEQVFGASVGKKFVETVEAGPKAFDRYTAAVSRHKTMEAAAQKQEDTLKGQMKILGSEVEDTAIKFGEKLLPPLTKAAHMFLTGATWVLKNKVAMLVLAGVVGGALATVMTVFAVNTMSKFAKSFSQATQTVSQFAQKMLGSASQTQAAGADIEETEEGIAATSEDAGPAAAGALGPIGIAIMAVAIIGMEVVKHWKTISHDLVAAFRWIGHEAVSIFHDLEGFFKKWWPEILGVFTGGIGLVVGLVIQHWHFVETWSKRIFDDVIGFFKHWWPEILGVFTGGIGLVVGLVIQHWHQIYEGTVHAFDDVIGFVKRIPGRILSGLGDMGHLLLHAGEDLIHGLWSGMSHMGSWLLDKIKGFADSILHHFTSIFHIFSPSGVMADRVGKPLVQGIAQGIEGERGRSLASAISAAERQIQTGWSLPTIGAGGAATASNGVGAGMMPGASNLSNRPVQLTVNTMAQPSPQELARAIGWELEKLQ